VNGFVGVGCGVCMVMKVFAFKWVGFVVSINFKNEARSLFFVSVLCRQH
jgi:hypothetical protein